MPCLCDLRGIGIAEEISTSEEYVHSSPYIVYRKGPSNSLLNWYKDLSDEYKDHPTNAKPTFSDISKAKALILAKVQPSGSKAKASRSSSSKAKVQPAGSRAKASSLVPITNDVLGLANAKIWDAILSKTFGVKLPPTMTCAEEKKGKRKIEEMIVLSSDSSDDSKGPSIASVPKERPSIQGLLDWYGYDTIKKYLEETFFPSTDKDSTEFMNLTLQSLKFVMLLECLVCVLIPFAVCDVIAASICNKHMLCCKLLHLQQAFAL
ncbi:hypothetical protein Tco_1035584 [Tanacetum coccineum]